ncbi:MAG: DsbA family protein [Anaerolineae bacterium]
MPARVSVRFATLPRAFSPPWSGRRRKVEAFALCLDTGKYAAQVRTDTAFAQSLGISGTPAFLVSGRPIMGAQPFETLRTLIEAELASNP